MSVMKSGVSLLTGVQECFNKGKIEAMVIGFHPRHIRRVRTPGKTKKVPDDCRYLAAEVFTPNWQRIRFRIYVWKKAFERSFHMPYDLISCQISFCVILLYCTFKYNFVLSCFIALSLFFVLLHFHFSLLYCNRLDDCFIEFLVKASKPTFTFLFLTFSNAFWYFVSATRTQEVDSTNWKEIKSQRKCLSSVSGPENAHGSLFV